MAEKRLNTRISHKRDISTNWNKATNFIPLDGEIIIYSDLKKFKVGDGVTTLSKLDFFNTDADKLDGKDSSDFALKTNIPSVGNGTVTITQNGTSKGSFTLNQSGNATIALTDTDTKYTHPAGSAPNKPLGLYKFSTDATSHISSVSTVSTADITGLGIAPSQHTHDKADITGLTASKAVVTDASGKLTTATATATEVGYLSGVTEAIQTQINNASKEAFFKWGGKNITGSYSPLDAAMVPVLGANRFAFSSNSSNGILIEYSRDGGATWQDYEASAASKANLFNGIGSSVVIGKDNTTLKEKSKYMVRATLTTNVSTIYTALNKFAIYCSTNGSSGCYCTIDARTKTDADAGKDTWRVFVNKQAISGWSGWNIINTSDITTYGNRGEQYVNIRFTFGVTSHLATSAYAGLNVSKILGFGGFGWTTATNLALNGTIYSHDAGFNVLFPADIKIKTGDSCNKAGEIVASQTWVNQQLGQGLFYKDLGNI